MSLENIEKQAIELNVAAKTDAMMSSLNGVDLNPFTTQGGRQLWQQGWDEVRPVNLTDGSGDWRFWERGRQARSLAQLTQESKDSNVTESLPPFDEPDASDAPNNNS